MKPTKSEEIAEPTISFREVVHKELLRSLKFMENNYPPQLYDRIREEFEYIMFMAVMDVTEGNFSKASRIFGVDRRNFYAKSRKYFVDHGLYKKAHGNNFNGKKIKGSTKKS